MKKRIKPLAIFLFVCLSLTGIQLSASAQGRGTGRGQGGPPSGGSGKGQPTRTGVDRGISTSSDMSNGRADIGRGRASDNSNGRSGMGMERARLQRENSHRADNELKDHPQMPARLQTTANSLRSGYQSALLTNPGLTFGQYVAATRLETNLRATHPNITRGAILAGLADGKSIGRSLQSLGLSEHQAKEAKKRAEREIKEAKRR
jgi:hypothetical protein